jgi:4-hydroxybutyryl-CoA dehydratase/vinylacetyl-CoA-Delta-isomerase
MDRVRYGRYIENATSITTMVEAMHGAGSPQAQRFVMLGLSNLKNKIALAEAVVEGDDDVLGITIRGRVVTEKAGKED